MKARPLVIIGDSAFAQIAYHYFNEGTDYKVVAFSVEKEFLKEKQLFDLPIIPFDELSQHCPPKAHSVFVAITYGQLNRLRARLVEASRRLGYALASYISPHAYISKQASIGEHCFIFENNVIQPYAEIGNDVILWSGNHIGHHSKIADHCFISSHVVISGYASIGKFCFFGVNSAISNNINVDNDCWIGPAVTISKDTKEGSLFQPPDIQASPISTYKFFKVDHPLIPSK